MQVRLVWLLLLLLCSRACVCVCLQLTPHHALVALHLGHGLLLGFAFLLSIFYHSSEEEVTAAVEMIRGKSVHKEGGTRVTTTAGAAAGGGEGDAAGEGVRVNGMTGKGTNDADGNPHNEDKTAGASYLFQRRFRKTRATKEKGE